jgi:ribosomal protein S3
MSQNGTGGYYGSYKEEKTTAQVTIPSDLAGALIGKRGERIRRVRTEVIFNLNLI